MAIKEFISRPAKWFNLKRPQAASNSTSTAEAKQQHQPANTTKVELVKPPKPISKERSLEMVQQGLTDHV